MGVRLDGEVKVWFDGEGGLEGLAVLLEEEIVHAAAEDAALWLSLECGMHVQQPAKVAAAVHHPIPHEAVLGIQLVLHHCPLLQIRQPLRDILFLLPATIFL